MTALSKAAPTTIAYNSLNSTLAETGWRMEWVRDEEGQKQLVYFPLTEAEFLHPQEGYHLPSNTFHGTAQQDLLDILQRRYAQREDVGVFGDLIVKWGIKGLGNHCPDVCVVFGLHQKEQYRTAFVVSEEGTKPAVVIEVVSPRYRRADRETKVKQYAQAGVQEYMILDRRRQRGEVINEVLGYRLEGESYLPIVPDEEGRIFSPVLQVKFGLKQGEVKLWEAATGEPLLSSQEIEEQARQEAQRAQAAEQRAQQERQRADQERQRADQERQRADQERQARQEAIPRLLALGLSVAQIAQALSLSIAEVQKSRDD